MIHGFSLKKSWFIVIMLALIAGVSVGALYSARAGADTDQILNGYLNGFFQALPEQNNKSQIFKNALLDNLRLFLFIFFSGFFRFGPVLAVGGVAAKGFVSGFTTAALVKYYGARGLFVNLCSLPATFLFLPVLIFYSIFAASFSGEREKREGHKWPGYLVISFLCLTIFCICAFADGYLTTIFMKLAAKNIVVF